MSQYMIEELLGDCADCDPSVHEVITTLQGRILSKIANTLPRSISDTDCEAIQSMLAHDIYSNLEEMRVLAATSAAPKLASLFDELPKSDQKALERILGKIVIENEELPIAA